MDYSLAKKLKDAGFPQTAFIGGHFYSSNGIRWQSSVERSEMTYGDVKEPTLSELIEACGESFGSVTRSPRNTWYATEVRGKGKNEYEMVVGEEVFTPLEAVANLYLALHAPEVEETPCGCPITKGLKWHTMECTFAPKELP